MQSIFEPALLEDLRVKAASSGIESLSDKELQILIGGYFNHRTSEITKIFRQMKIWGISALWAIAASLIANLIVALIH